MEMPQKIIAIQWASLATTGLYFGVLVSLSVFFKKKQKVLITKNGKQHKLDSRDYSYAYYNISLAFKLQHAQAWITNMALARLHRVNLPCKKES